MSDDNQHHDVGKNARTFGGRWRAIEKKIKRKTGGAASRLGATGLLTDSWAIVIKEAFVDADARIAELEATVEKLPTTPEMVRANMTDHFAHPNKKVQRAAALTPPDAKGGG